MKVITVWQPWASLIAIGAKPYEFRGWSPPPSIIGQRIGIHAAARKVKVAEVDGILHALENEAWQVCLKRDIAAPFLRQVVADPDALPLSAIVATAVFGAPVDAGQIAAEYGASAINDSDRDEHFNYAWPMRDVRPLLPPVEARGAQGFWNYGGTL